MKNKIKIKPRCKLIAAIIDNKLQVIPLIREEIWEPFGDFDDDDTHMLVGKFRGYEVYLFKTAVLFVD